MRLLPDGRAVVSASDLRTASSCEFALVAGLDVLLGRRAPAAAEHDPMQERVAALGDEHEQAELRRLSQAHPGRVRTMAVPSAEPAALAAAMAETLAALTGDVDVLAQATLFDGTFVGRADFLERTPAGWVVSDTKLARHETVPALLQVGAYAALLAEAGVPLAPYGRLVLGGGEVSDLPLAEVMPVYRARRARLEALVADHLADPAPAAWGDDRWLACGACPVCEAEVTAHRDLLLVAGVRRPTRRRLLEAGVRTVEDLAARTDPVPDVRATTLERLREQARLQLEQESDPTGRVRYEVVDPDALRRMPPPSPGDVFFDFEGDPLWRERGSSTWGLEYLFGLVEVDSGTPRFRAFWAHERSEERRALVEFVAYLSERRRRWPDLHVYHYAPYEPAALLRLAARHGVCEDDVDQLLREGVFVDLYAVVRAGIRVSQRSYSIKKLEPLYMDAREGPVQGGAESIVAYHQYLQARVEGRTDEADALLAEIADYNEDDCVSTHLLREWLLERRRETAGEAPAGPQAEPVAEVEVSETRRRALELEAALRALVEDVPPAERTPEQQAVALVGSAVLYHAREDKPRWQEHFERLRLPTADWRPAEGVFLVERVEVVQGWHRPPRARKDRRTLALHGEPMRGVAVAAGTRVSAVYAVPGPDGVDAEPLHAHAKSPAGVEVLEAKERVAPNGRLEQTLVVDELQPGPLGHEVGPVALVPNDTVSSAPLDRAIAEVAQAVRATGALPVGAGTDLLLRRPPRLRGGAPLPRVAPGPDGDTDAITAALQGMDDSYVAVQGPPGTGKTYVGARVVARLVAQGWAVGVCAQGHAAVENVLDAVVRAGVDPAQVAKAPKHTVDPAWTALRRADDLAAFAAGHRGAGRGYVIGGSAWDMTTEARVGRGQLDLLVVDEAGQLSLAKTLAVSLATRRLLLLGDPQQLPQVTTGTHAEPVDRSALAWLAGDEAVLPPQLGYFLATTWRMHPALTAPVSALAYDGRLRSQETVTARRRLEGVEPGLHVRLVDHRDSSTWSVEEAIAVRDLVEDLVGRAWSDPGPPGSEDPLRAARPLTSRDIVVITPYNHQVGTIRAVLDAAGHDEVAVGTVDRFQGQEAPVAIVSMAASSPTDVSRGIGFLLDRHRLNVAISRGQHSAFLVRSPLLTDLAPRTPQELVALGAFLRLGEEAVTTAQVAPVLTAVP
ncbi:TM0106 family RecB-like putative nuclease [Phycicoccus endophyticus]|uniref:TM0106 family RecB-like putative nuclease n=1 Tax=Phycicoccus endophyticus TaxID=1690220 RepID=A0A7G9R2C3_9MICO|nr:bifunctional RecB family nuclease/DEAD/DEAH box helicase [Phycicoccus endophyticus]NHI20873.1 TM0106 family RecB-like putative nuclease [Phycicoccus endophyticus]QNN49748.1 TM0106 family RecB-like putative nuclease [Phycicoccus endophyticus]GGL34779.1 ATPase [Phycicoccus endophyticus]